MKKQLHIIPTQRYLFLFRIQFLLFNVKENVAFKQCFHQTEMENRF